MRTVYYRPARVIVDDGHGWLAVLAGICILAAISFLAAFIEAALLVVLIVLAVACAGGLALLAHALYRDGIWLTWRPLREDPALEPGNVPAALPQSARQAIEAPRAIQGVVVRAVPAETRKPRWPGDAA